MGRRCTEKIPSTSCPSGAMEYVCFLWKPICLNRYAERIYNPCNDLISRSYHTSWPIAIIPCYIIWANQINHKQQNHGITESFQGVVLYPEYALLISSFPCYNSNKSHEKQTLRSSKQCHLYLSISQFTMRKNTFAGDCRFLPGGRSCIYRKAAHPGTGLLARESYAGIR